MRITISAFVLLACLATQGLTQQPALPESIHNSTTLSQSLLDIEFKLAPVELNFSGELAKAKDAYEAGEWHSAIEAATEFLNRNPTHTQRAAGLFLRGEANVQLQRYELVKRDFELLLQSDPNTTQRIRAEFRLAEAAMLSGKWDDARRKFEDFRTGYPSDELNAYVTAYLAETIGRKNTPWAKALYVESIQTFPTGPLNRRARLHLALIRFSEGNHQIARTDLEKLIATGDRTSDDYWTAWYWLAHAELQAGKSKAAIERLLTFADEFPNHELAASAVFQAANATRKAGEHKQAVSLYQQVRSDWPSSQYAKATVIGEMKSLKKLLRHTEALQRFDDSDLDTSPEIKQQATQLAAEILIASKDYDRAEALIKPYVVTASSSQDATARNRHYTNLYLLALAQRGQGKYGTANELLGRVRQELVTTDLAERVLLARIETWGASKDYNEAVQAAFQFEVRYPASNLLPAVRNQLVSNLIELGRFEEAHAKLKQLKNSTGAEKYVARAAERVADSAYERGDYTTARNAYETLEMFQESDTAAARALTGLAWIDRKQGNNEAAAKRFSNFVEAFPNHPSIWPIRLAFAETLADVKRTDEAIQVLEPFEGLPVGHPQRPRGLYQLAELAKQEPSLRPRATEVIQTLLEDHPDFEQIDGALYLAGMLHRQTGENEADLLFIELVKEHPKSQYWSDALYRLAESAHAKQDNGIAKKYLTRLISAERDETVMPHALFMRGRLESDEKKWPQARETLRELLRKYPDSKLVNVARYGIAESFFQEKQFERASQLFQILDEENRFAAEDAWGAMVQLRSAQLEVHRKNLVRATKIAQQIEDAYPNFTLQHEVDYLVGRVAAARGEFADAREAYQKVVARDSTYQQEITAMAQWMIGETYFHQKQYILAIKAYEVLVVDLQFENWQAASHLQIGKCYELLGNLEQAKTSYSRVTQRYRDSKWADEAEYRLESLSESE